MSQNYFAVIGDIVDSRKIENREEVQNKVKSVLDNINKTYSQSIKSKFLITLGDEFQGLLLPHSPVNKIMSEILDDLYPVEFRFGLGFGEITTEISEYALGMDGPAFYLARQAVEESEKEKGASVVFKANVMDELKIRNINVMFNSLFIIRRLWSDQFKSNLKFIRKNQTQNELAKELGVYQSTVSNLLNKNQWYSVKKVEKEIDFLLSCYFN